MPIRLLGIPDLQKRVSVLKRTPKFNAIIFGAVLGQIGNTSLTNDILLALPNSIRIMRPLHRL
jgi:hypothetical protein